MHPLLLASSSIYRKELLSRLQIPFNTYSPEIDESRQQGEAIPAMVCRLAKEKALAAATLFPNTVCIGSDEVAALNDTILGKPGNHDSARQQLQSMNGKKIGFYTGICVAAPFLNHEDCRLNVTYVQFRTLTESMIENYLQKERPYGSAGSFKSESLGSALIERFEGDDPTSIIGLPLIILCDMLEKVGINVI